MNSCKRLIKREWSIMWQEFVFTNPTKYTNISPEIPSKFWHDNFNLPRKYVIIINRIKFGHGCYPSHLYRTGISPTNSCNVEGDLDHIFFNCSKHTDTSNELYKKLINLKIEIPFNLLHLICLNNNDILGCLDIIFT